MTSRIFRINWPAIVLAAAFVIFAGYQSMAMRNLIQLKPAVIATVDLHRVLTDTDERAAQRAEIEKIARDFEKQSEGMVKKLQELDEELELLVVGTDQHQQVLEKLALATLEYQGFSEWARQRVAAESAIRLRRLYDSAKKVISEEATRQGYDIVMVNDSLGELRAGDEAEVTMQISARRMLFSGQHLDITEDVITRMNAATRSAQSR